MSYDIDYVDDNGDTIQLTGKNQCKGGTYALEGTDLASLNITYNYSKFFIKAFGEKGIQELDGLLINDAKVKIEKAVAKLSDEGANDDYWDGTEGNARKALIDLLSITYLTMAERPKTAVCKIT